MRWSLRVLFLLLLIGLVLPVVAIDENRIGYVSFDQAKIQLEDGNARVEVDYTLDPGIPMIVLLFGAGDLQKKVERSLNFPSLKAEEVGLSRAVFTVDGVSDNYGNRAYWFSPHTFGVTFPRVQVIAPGFTMSYTGVGAITKGFGFFGDS